MLLALCMRHIVYTGTWHTSRHGKSNGLLPVPVETGKKGAMPEPILQVISLVVFSIFRSNSSLPLSRYCPYFSILTNHTPASNTRCRSGRLECCSQSSCENTKTFSEVFRGASRRSLLAVPNTCSSPGQSRWSQPKRSR